MLGGGGGIHFGAFGVTSELHAMNASRITPATEPNPQVKAAIIPTMKGERPRMMRSRDEGFSSKDMTARRSLDLAIRSPSMQKEAMTQMTLKW